jgi:hypothetical protein
MNIHCHSDVGEQAIVIMNSHVEGVRGDNTERKKGNVRVGMGESSDDLRMRSSSSELCKSWSSQAEGELSNQWSSGPAVGESIQAKRRRRESRR